MLLRWNRAAGAGAGIHESRKTYTCRSTVSITLDRADIGPEQSCQPTTRSRIVDWRGRIV
jgi:hypothetical protein